MDQEKVFVFVRIETSLADQVSLVEELYQRVRNLNEGRLKIIVSDHDLLGEGTDA